MCTTRDKVSRVLRVYNSNVRFTSFYIILWSYYYISDLYSVIGWWMTYTDRIWKTSQQRFQVSSRLHVRARTCGHVASYKWLDAWERHTGQLMHPGCENSTLSRAVQLEKHETPAAEHAEHLVALRWKEIAMEVPGGEHFTTFWHHRAHRPHRTIRNVWKHGAHFLFDRFLLFQSCWIFKF